MAKGDKKEKKEKKRGSAKVTIFMVIFSLIMIVVFQTGYIFFLMGMLPTIIAFYVDRSRSHNKFQTVMACNLSGIIPIMARMLMEKKSATITTELMSDPMNWLIIYASAAFGWMLVFMAPLFAQFLISMFHQGQIARFQNLQDRIVRDWGPEVENIFPKDQEED